MALKKVKTGGLLKPSLVGPQGDRGPAGERGADGAIGAAGAIGATGPRGDSITGGQGIRGPQGPIPIHRWVDDTHLQFQIDVGPNGEPIWGQPVDLQGEPGEQGEQGYFPGGLGERDPVNFTLSKDGDGNITDINMQDGRVISIVRAADIITEVRGLGLSTKFKAVLQYDVENSITGINFERDK